MVEVQGKMAPPAIQVTPVGAPNPAPTADPSKTAGSIKAVGAPFQVTPLHQADKWFKAIFYAKHGIGKTELCGTAVDVPEMRDVLYVNAERGSMTLNDSPRIKNAHMIKQVTINDFKSAASIQEFLKANCAARDRNDMPTMKKLWCLVTGLNQATLPDAEVPIFRTVIVDSLTEIETYSQYQILGIDIEGNKLGQTVDTAGWPEFRKNLEMVKLLTRAYRDLPMHVLFICSETFTQDESRKFSYSPALTGQLARQIQGFVDMVGYLVAGESTMEQPEAPRRLFIQPITGLGAKFDAKNRRSVYRSPFFDNPTMLDIMVGIKLVTR